MAEYPPLNMRTMSICEAAEERGAGVSIRSSNRHAKASIASANARLLMSITENLCKASETYEEMA